MVVQDDDMRNIVTLLHENQQLDSKLRIALQAAEGQLSHSQEVAQLLGTHDLDMRSFMSADSPDKMVVDQQPTVSSK
jgi:hypothetical protein